MKTVPLCTASVVPLPEPALPSVPTMCVRFLPESQTMLEAPWLVDHLLPLANPGPLHWKVGTDRSWCNHTLLFVSASDNCDPVDRAMGAAPIGIRIGVLLLSDENCACDTRTVRRRPDYVLRNYDCADVREAEPNAPIQWIPNGPIARVGIVDSGAVNRVVVSNMRTTRCFFHGQVNASPERQEAARWMRAHPEFPCIFGSTNKFTSGLDIRDYSITMRDTVFALVIPGNGRHPDTYRMWEVLEAGAIPLYIRRKSWPHAIELDETCPIPILDGMGDVGAYLEMPADKVDRLQVEIVRWYAHYKHRLIANIARVMNTAK